MSDVTPENPDFIHKVEEVAGEVAAEVEHLVEVVDEHIPSVEEVVSEVEKVVPFVEELAPQTTPVFTEAEHFVKLAETLAEAFRQHAVEIEKFLGDFINKTGFKR